MTPFHKQITTHPPFYEKDRAQLFFADLLQSSSGDEQLAPLQDLISPAGPVRDLLVSIMGLSPFLRALMLRQSLLLQDCLLAPSKSHIKMLCEKLALELSQTTDLNEAMKLLRVFKQNTALSIALYDSAGVALVDEIIKLITKAADCAVQEAVSFLFNKARLAGQLDVPEGSEPAQNCGYFVLAMGKQGGFELNYSSDIDLIILYDPERSCLREGIEPQSFFVRLTRDLVMLLNERTPEGYVYRTDLRLRPDPGATQLAMSSAAALVYYENYGQNWERAAMIKARVVAGDRQAGKKFLAELSPYIWRKYLDFATLNDIHAMKRQIHAVKGHGEVTVAGHNIKLGRGGIREIEFFVQTQQLIAGGRQEKLRGRSTLKNLKRLRKASWISKRAEREMSAAYRFLRHVEHRLQMVEDAQTQTLPQEGEELRRIARFCGFDRLDEFAKELTGHLLNVQNHYAGLFEEQPGEANPHQSGDLVFTGGDPHPGTFDTLQQMGFKEPARAIAIVQDWHRARYRSTRSKRTRESLTELTPQLLAELAATGTADTALLGFDKFLKRLPAGVQLFALLRAHPDLLRLLAQIMGTAPRLAKALSQRARLLDAVLDPSFFGLLPDRGEIDEVFKEALAQARDYSERLDVARIKGREQGFLIGVRVLTDTISPDQAGKAYSDLAASVLSHLHEVVKGEIEQAHGGFAKGGSCLLAMGKVGGAEMTASSDVDLILVYETDPEQTMSMASGRPLAVSQYYNRLTQRLITALSAPTPEGMLYEVDMRLRPSGNAGPVATNLQSFAHYQREKAWTWEHMALTRARIVAVPKELGTKLQELIKEVLCLPRDRSQVARDVVEMRQRIFAQKGSANPWQLKQVRGGLIDLEFLVQYLQLIHAHEHPDCLDQNTCKAVGKLATAGALVPGDADLLLEGAFLLHMLMQILRLCTDKEFDAQTAPEGLKKLLARAADSPDFTHLEARLKETQANIFRLFEKYVGAGV
ncbi:MAG: bifunctional [glutamine synthetase] adenylyltransferase/[glutamine synthetase]-adenylyl-L-tyrosine phosphorylase [Hyphomicrobiaceae bacterium]|nr:bifunctional [glutamine synthetase] adenylyltransferase/[glutamine synthetase]-adenylyl-L-tyrosine phosphorylase [Hyphomicrobiaceae bacterium]